LKLEKSLLWPEGHNPRHGERSQPLSQLSHRNGADRGRSVQVIEADQERREQGRFLNYCLQILQQPEQEFLRCVIVLELPSIGERYLSFEQRVEECTELDETPRLRRALADGEAEIRRDTCAFLQETSLALAGAAVDDDDLAGAGLSLAEALTERGDFSFSPAKREPGRPVHELSLRAAKPCDYGFAR
jgi:hypothetical protein